jgi:hypothetical protein
LWHHKKRRSVSRLGANPVGNKWRLSFLQTNFLSRL